MKNFKAIRFAMLLCAIVCCVFNATAQTGKPKTTPVKSSSASGSKQFDPAKLTRFDIDSLRQTGKSNAELAELMKGKKSTKEMLLILKKTPPQTGISGKKVPVKPTGSGSSSTPPPPPPPPPFTAEDEADAVEMAQILVNAGAGRHYLTYEELSALWEIYGIPDLSTMLRVLDTGGLFELDEIVVYASIFSTWLAPRNTSGGSGQAATVFPAPDWLNQYPAFYDLYLSKGAPAGRIYHEFLFGLRGGRMGVVSPPVAFFTVSGNAKRALIITEISGKYNCSEQVTLRSVMEYGRNELGGIAPGAFIRDENVRSAKTPEFWAATLKLDNVPNGSGGNYPAFTAAEATDALIRAGYTTIQAATAVRAVYQ